ncbi:MAG: hypothetical protein LC791_16770 [Acidobacteria bacterium]|nr:hypothetical protein [Acidobacteriota bacterium]
MRVLYLLTIILTLSLPSAHAITLVPLPFADLVAQAHVVAYGRVAQVDGQWTDDRQAIESLITLDVIERFKGGAGDTLTFKVPGGRAGNIVNVWPGAPEFRRGDLVVVFLAARGPAIPTLVGLTQGVLHVGLEGRSGALTVAPPLGFNGESGTIARGAPDRAPVRLASFAERVRLQVEAGR